MTSALSAPKLTTVDEKEIQHFAKLAATWWDEIGPYKGLHQLNPLRIEYILDRISQHFEIADNNKPLTGLNILDIGCGGGLLCEPMARLGANITGIDATSESIEVAKLHAHQMDLDINYECTGAENKGGQYDVVLCMEIVEHVSDLESFIKAAALLVRPGGLIFLSTLNRTLKSYIFGIVAAEYILGWVPKGTHQWEKFVKPKELKDILRENNVEPFDLKGVIMNPFEGVWKTTSRLGVNYMMTAVKP